jgi:hypothetical protein
LQGAAEETPMMMRRLPQRLFLLLLAAVVLVLGLLDLGLLDLCLLDLDLLRLFHAMVLLLATTLNFRRMILWRSQAWLGLRITTASAALSRASKQTLDAS